MRWRGSRQACALRSASNLDDGKDWSNSYARRFGMGQASLRSGCSVLYLGIETLSEGAVEVEASDLVTIRRTELDALKAELKRLRREVGRSVAKARIQADVHHDDDAPTFTRDQLAQAWGIGE